MAMARQEDSTVMLSAAKHLVRHVRETLRCAQGDTRGSGQGDNQRNALPIERDPSLRSELALNEVNGVTRKGHPIQRHAISAPLPSRPRPSGILDLCLSLMDIG